MSSPADGQPKRARSAARSGVTFQDDVIKLDEAGQLVAPQAVASTPVSDVKAASAATVGASISSPPRNPRMSRAARAGAMADVSLNDSYVLLGEERMPRATSGSEVGLELDPDLTKVVEVYGFVGWITSFLAWICYLLWAYLPEHVLHDVGVSYYPNKYWAIAAPATLVAAVCTYSTVYGAIGLAANPPLSSRDTLADGYSKRLTLPPASSAATAAAQSGSAASSVKAGVAADRSRRAVAVAADSGSGSGSGNGEGAASSTADGPATASGLPPLSAMHVRASPLHLHNPALCADCRERAAAAAGGGTDSGAAAEGGSQQASAPAATASSGGATRMDRSQALVYHVSTPQPSSSSSGGGSGAGGSGAGGTRSPMGSPLGSRRQSSGSGSGIGLLLHSVSGAGGSGAGAGGGSGGASPALRSPAPAPPQLLLSIDPFMPTPDLADLPVTLVNKLQFSLGPRLARQQMRRVSASPSPTRPAPVVSSGPGTGTGAGAGTGAGGSGSKAAPRITQLT